MKIEPKLKALVLRRFYFSLSQGGLAKQVAEPFGWTVVSVLGAPFSHVERTGEGVGLQIVTGINWTTGVCECSGVWVLSQERTARGDLGIDPSNAVSCAIQDIVLEKRRS